MLGSMVGCIDYKFKNFLRAEQPRTCYGNGSPIITTRGAVPCNGRRVGVARLRGSSPPRPISLEQTVVRSHVQVCQSGASAPPLTVSARAGGIPYGRLLGSITQSAVSGGGYSQHMQSPNDSTEAINCMSVPHPTLYRRLSL